MRQDRSSVLGGDDWVEGPEALWVWPLKDLSGKGRRGS
jgi:hypothetical protein